MSLCRAHHQVRMPLTLNSYNFLYYIALSYQDIVRPSGQVRRFNYRRVFPLAAESAPPPFLLITQEPANGEYQTGDDKEPKEQHHKHHADAPHPTQPPHRVHAPAPNR
jgi:hypothetical protein